MYIYNIKGLHLEHLSRRGVTKFEFERLEGEGPRGDIHIQ